MQKNNPLILQLAVLLAPVIIITVLAFTNKTIDGFMISILLVSIVGGHHYSKFIDKAFKDDSK